MFDLIRAWSSLDCFLLLFALWFGRFLGRSFILRCLQQQTCLVTMSDPRHNGSTSSTGDTPYHSTPQRPHFADDFQSPSLFTSSKSKLMKEVIAEIDREISTRKKELSALRSRSATKRRPSHKNQVSDPVCTAFIGVEIIFSSHLSLINKLSTSYLQPRQKNWRRI